MHNVEETANTVSAFLKKQMHERNKSKENFAEKNNIYISSDDLVFGITAKAKSKVHNYLAWADNKLQLLAKNSYRILFITHICFTFFTQHDLCRFFFIKNLCQIFWTLKCDEFPLF